MTAAQALKEVLNEEVAKSRFGMPSTSTRATKALFGTRILRDVLSLMSVLGEKESTYLFRSALRAAFLIELVKEDVKSTKMAVRWSPRFGLDDIRYASFDASFEVFEKMMLILTQVTQDAPTRSLLQSLGRDHRAFELPIDYRERRRTSPIHTPDNVEWIEGNLPHRVLKLRAVLLNRKENPQYPFFSAAYEKVEVKSYKTDRAQTGDYKTNREKRWESNPAGVQFALRRDCMEVEYRLLNQLCHFEGFNEELRSRLEEAELLSRAEVPFRCPVTMDPLSFVEFEREVMDPRHGKANFHVGHLNPLKATNDDPRSGHTAQNISWITSDGNRIQGHLSLQETRALLERIRTNYSETEGN